MRTQRQARNTIGSAMIAPVIAWLALFVVVPAIILLLYSFCDRDEHGEIVYSFTLANYRRAFEPVYARIFLRSINYAALTTLICVIAGYPVAYFVGRTRSPRLRDWVILAIMIPFCTSFVIRTYAMTTILSESGPLSSALMWMRIISQPLDVLYTPGAIVLGLVYTYLPFMILPIYASVQKLDNSLIEAAHDLGAGPTRAFVHVILPLTWSGIAAGIVLVFVPAVAMFAVSDLLGGGKTLMIGNILESQFVGLAHDWPFGSALGVLLLLMFVIALIALEEERMLEVRNPYSGELIERVPLADAGELDRVAASAHAAFESFSREPAFRRADLLARIASLVESRKADFARTIMLEAGKPITLAEAEVDRAVWTFTSASLEARQFHGETLAADAYPSGAGHVAIAKRFPVGVVYGITPFNFPLNLVAHKVAPALACGNTIVIKPSPKAPLSALLLKRVIDEAGAPANVVSVVVCDNAHGMRLIDHPRVRFISFTGSVPVGWKVHEAAAKAKKRTTLELGGNAGVIVHHDADIDSAIPLIARGAFSYAGQSCISVQRVFVHQRCADDFISKFVEHVKQDVRCGDPSDREVIAGPMIDEAAQIRVIKAIDAARAAGATIHCGGKAVGRCIEPTVITGAAPHLDVCASEIFAPVVVIGRYNDFDDALARVNDSPFGLQAGVFTRDIGLAMRAFEDLEVGGVMINQVPTFRLENMPYGGVKDSGHGREGVRFAIEEMTELRALMIKTE